ncbi:MAG: 1-acyl-sn-glycerol-3-phosphate acyltransferase [Deltaproteobacteria bacterium]|nr:1-acyl-sn-glycerol-3-phosphate acyltransferase [Deltaproteobacteria bacterium]
MKKSVLDRDPNELRFVYRLSRFLFYWVYKIVWRLQIRHAERVPLKGSLIIASNHKSYADPQVVGITIPRPVHFLAKEELFRFRPFGWIITQCNAHPLKRRGGDIAALRLSVAILSKNGALIIFPEGGRGKTDHFQPAKAGLGLLAQKTGAPILPMYIHNSGHIGKFKKLIVSFGKPIYANHHHSHQALADEAMSQIAKLKQELEEYL